MRSLFLGVFISLFLASNQAWSQTKFNLFTIEKPIENYQNSQLNARLQSAMEDLLVRVVGDEQILASEQAQNYIKTARSWVKNFSFENREADGVIIGQKLVVEFDRTRLLNQFQIDGISIWPLSYRPKTLLLGHWAQSGLTAKMSQETLQYRIDLDPTDYARLLALEIDLPATDADFSELYSKRLLTAENLQNDWQPEFADYDYLLVFNANVIGEVVGLQGQLFATDNQQKVLNLEATADNFQHLIQDVYADLLKFYSAPYRAGASDFGVFQLAVENLPSYQALEALEEFLIRLKPAFREIKLIKMQTTTAYFDVYYQGSYQDAVKLLTGTPKLKILEESLYSGELRATYN